MPVANSRNQRVFLQKESTLGVIPNSSGTATVAGSNFCSITSFQLAATQALIRRGDKTGTRTPYAGTKGTRGGSWSYSGDLVANGAAGVVPDCDPILVSIFGADATIVAATSVTYNLADAVKSFTAYNFLTPSGMMQQAAAGCVAASASWQLNQDVAKWSANGSLISVVDSVNFGSMTTAEKCGLTAFPSEPGSPVSNGNLIPGFTGALTVDGNTVAALTSMNINIGVNNGLIRTFGNYQATESFGEVRNVTASCEVRLDTVTAITNMIQKGYSKAAVQIIAEIGMVVGNRYQFTLKGVQLEQPTESDSGPFWTLQFGSSPASGSSISAVDEISLKIY